MIAIQAKAVCIQPGNPVTSVPRAKKRIISTEPLMLPTYNAGVCVGPSQMQAIEGDIRHQAVNLKFSKKKLLKSETQNFKKSQTYFCEDQWKENSEQV